MTGSSGRYHFRLGKALLGHFDAVPAIKEHALNFLLAGGFLAGHSDGEFSEEERQYLAVALAAAFGDDPSAFESVTSPEQAVAMLDTSCEWLKEHGGATRNLLFRHLAELVAVDHVLDPGELEFVRDVAEKLGLAPDHAMHAIQDVFADS